MDYLDEIAREQRNQIEAVEKGFDPFHISPEDIEKGRKAQLGEIRQWKDGKYQMTTNGWVYIKGSDPNIKGKKAEEGSVSKDKNGVELKVGDKIVFEKISVGRRSYLNGVVTGKDSLGNIKAKFEGNTIESGGIPSSQVTKIPETPEKKEDGKAKYQKLEADVNSKTKELQSLPGYTDLLNPQNRKKDFGKDKKVKSMHIGIETNYSEGTSHFQVRVGHAEAPMFGEESDKWNKSVNEFQSKKFSTAKEAAAAVEEFASKHNTEKILAADAFPKMQEHLNKLNLGFIQIPRDLDSSGKWSEEKPFRINPKDTGSLMAIYEKIEGISKWGVDPSGNIYGNIHFRWNHVGGGSNGYSVELKFDKSGNLLKTTRG